MAKADVLDILRARKMDPLEFHFESLWIPPMNYYLSQQDINELHSIATSSRLSSKIRQKYDMIDAIMTRRGFKRFSAGTNRVVYRFLDDSRFLAKIAVDKVGMQDNPLEYQNQFLLQPFVTKMFYVSPCGTVGFSERVLPVKNKAEFREIASDVFDILVHKILGMYVVEDVGTKYFMNWGIRMGFGPVLLDYPYVYKLDGDKLYCNWIRPETSQVCDGEIDYDEGFNHLVCSRCGKVYLATNLRDDSADNNLIIRKGGNEMRIIVKRGDQIIDRPIPTDEVMVPDRKPAAVKNNGLKIKVRGPMVLNQKEELKKSEKEANPVSEIVNNSSTEEIKPHIQDYEPNVVSSFIKPSHAVEETTEESVSSDEEIMNKSEDEDVLNKWYGEETADDNIEYDNNQDDEDEDDIVLASDVDLERREKQARAERNSFISTGNGSNKKNKKDKRDKKNNFIPSGTAYSE